MERIVNRISGDLDNAPDPAAEASEIEDSQDHLTEKQKTLLAATRSLNRVRFSGGAGSGKTWLAVEKAAQLAKEGKRVGLLCYNKGLGQHLRTQVSARRQAQPLFTGEFHEYAKLLGVPDGSGQEYFDEAMPRQLRDLMREVPVEQKLDAVVVDEAQDFAPLWWDAVLSCLKDPEHDQVYAFMDDRQDVYQRWSGAEPSESPISDLVPIHIDDNLRNTRQIANVFKSFAGDHFTLRGSNGLPVRRVQCTTEDALELASDAVDALINEGWAANQIALLTTNKRHPIHQDRFENGTVDEYWQEFHRDEAEFYGHVLGFKGLERSVVILCVDGFKDLGRAAEQLYVGLSRARSLLVVVGDGTLLREAGGWDLDRALARAESWNPRTAQR